MKPWSIITTEVIAGGIALWLIYDLFVELVVGGEWATISRTLFHLNVRDPLFGPLFVYSMSLLMGHLFLVNYGPKPPLWERWISVILALTPCAVAFLIIAISPMKMLYVMPQDHGWLQYVSLAFWSVIGLLVGKLLVCQYVAFN